VLELLMDDGLDLLIDQGLMLLVDNWLDVLVHVFLSNYGLASLMDHILMAFM